jgi:hypothetical protein
MHLLPRGGSLVVYPDGRLAGGGGVFFSSTRSGRVVAGGWERE